MVDSHEEDSYQIRVVFDRKLEDMDLVDLHRDSMNLLRDKDPYHSDIRRNNSHPYNREMSVHLDNVHAMDKDHFLHDDDL